MNGRNKNDELLKQKKSEQEDKNIIAEEIEEKSEISKILSNKKIMLPIYAVLIILGIIFVMSPGKEKEEKTNENIQTSENIDVEQLKNDRTEESNNENSYTSNNNSQDFFSFDDSNLPQGYSTDVPSIEQRTVNTQSYGNYPSSYNLDALPSDESPVRSSNSQRSTQESRKNSSISFEKNGNNAVQENQGSEQTATQPQPPQSSQKKTFQLNSGLTAPSSPYEIKTGEVIPAILMTGIDSDLSGNITAVVREDVYDSIRGRYLLIPKGSKLYGTYDSNIIYGQNRLMLIWQRIILPNGYSINLETMQGIDMTGQAGIKGKVNNHTLKLLRSVVLSALFNFVSSGVGVTYNNNTGSSDNVSVSATIGKDVTDDTAAKIQNAGDMIVARDLQQQPTIKIKAGTKFLVMVNNDMVLYPYEKLKGAK